MNVHFNRFLRETFEAYFLLSIRIRVYTGTGHMCIGRNNKNIFFCFSQMTDDYSRNWIDCDITIREFRAKQCE